MLFKTAEISPLENYRLLVCGVTPRPIAWISTRSQDGVDNLAPYSFFNVVSCNPPVLMFSHLQPQTRKDKDTLRNVIETGECVVNVVSHTLAESMNQTCANLPPEQSEFEFAQLNPVASTHVQPLGVADAPVRYECTLREVVRFGSMPMSGAMVLLNVVAVHVQDDLMLDGGMIKQTAIDTVGKMGGDWYATTRDLFELARPF